jgi:hypothetical protein
MKEYMPEGCVTANFTAIPNVRIVPLATKLHALFVQSQIDMLEEMKANKSDPYHNGIPYDDIDNKITSLKQLL